MTILDLISNFYDAVDMIDTPITLSKSLSSICRIVGFDYFSISDHGDFSAKRANLVRIHNYPAHFSAFHDSEGFGMNDPVHRLSQLRGSGFLWSRIPELLPHMTERDHEVFARKTAAGIGPGYTRPFHVPGRRSGSASFAVRTGMVFPRHHIVIAEALGAFAFEAASRIIRPHDSGWMRDGWFTPRERQTVMWLGRGESEKQIGRRLEISPATVNDHLKHARKRFGIQKSSTLVILALLSGAIGYEELLTESPAAS